MKDEIKQYFTLCKGCPVNCPLPGPPDMSKCRLREQEAQRIHENLLRELDIMEHSL
jgi:hypothetical protein